jgi:hypothetical protein
MTIIIKTTININIVSNKMKNTNYQTVATIPKVYRKRFAHWIETEGTNIYLMNIPTKMLYITFH